LSLKSFRIPSVSEIPMPRGLPFNRFGKTAISI
jgi:hypothetical protein